MTLYMFLNDGERIIDPNSPIRVSIETAVEELLRIPHQDDFDGAFIGFSNDYDETIQFIRFDDDSWLIDVPVLDEDGNYQYSLQDMNLRTYHVKQIIENFNDGEEWKGLIRLSRIE
jgi:hypothetical protein